MNKITRKNVGARFYIKQSFYGSVSNFESFYNGMRKRNKIRRYLKNKGNYWILREAKENGNGSSNNIDN